MTRLEIDWPDAGAARVRAARGRLEQAGRALRALSFEERLGAIRDVLEAWTRPDSAWRRALAAELAASTTFDPRTLSEGLDSALRAWNPDRFVECTRRELGFMLGSDGRIELAPFAWTAVIAGGAIPMPTLLSGLLPLVLGSPVILRETTRDPVTASLIARSLAERSSILARAFEPISLPKQDEPAMAALLEAPCVVATGSDETMRAIRERVEPNQRFVGYGHRFSIGVVDPGAVSTDDLAGFALDIARWDQSGCLSPVLIYARAGDPRDCLGFAAALAEELERVGQSLPLGAMTAGERTFRASERSEARLRAAAERALLFEGESATVVLEMDTMPRPAPLNRFVRVIPITDLNALEVALRPFAGHLASVGVGGLSARDRELLRDLASFFGVSRLSQPGRMQTPPIDWPHDGLGNLTPLARFVQCEPIDATENTSEA